MINRFSNYSPLVPLWKVDPKSTLKSAGKGTKNDKRTESLDRVPFPGCSRVKSHGNGSGMGRECIDRRCEERNGETRGERPGKGTLWTRLKALSTSLILDNYKRYILRKDSPFSDQVVVDGHKDNAYYEALKSIGTSLQPLLHEIKHESAPGEMVIADVEESEHSVGVGAFVKVRVNEESSEYDHVEGVQEDRSPVVGKNCRNQLR